jgi:hypothetical protein
LDLKSNEAVMDLLVVSISKEQRGTGTRTVGAVGLMIMAWFLMCLAISAANIVTEVLPAMVDQKGTEIGQGVHGTAMTIGTMRGIGIGIEIGGDIGVGSGQATVKGGERVESDRGGR